MNLLSIYGKKIVTMLWKSISIFPGRPLEMLYGRSNQLRLRPVVIGILLMQFALCQWDLLTIPSQTIYTSDPAPMVHDGVLYVYTGHDEPGSTYFIMCDCRLFSTADMVNWTDHGAIFAPTQFDWAKQGEAWVAQCVEKDGKFYFYITATHRARHQPVIGVAVADNPAWPFVDILGHPLTSYAFGGH